MRCMGEVVRGFWAPGQVRFAPIEALGFGGKTAAANRSELSPAEVRRVAEWVVGLRVLERAPWAL